MIKVILLVAAAILQLVAIIDHIMGAQDRLDQVLQLSITILFLLTAIQLAALFYPAQFSHHNKVLPTPAHRVISPSVQKDFHSDITSVDSHRKPSVKPKKKATGCNSGM